MHLPKRSNKIEQILERRLFVPLFFLIISLALYFPTFFYEYTYFDDTRLIQENFWFISNPANIPSAFSRDVFVTAVGSFYRPFMTISLMGDAVLSQSPDNLLPFRLTNILLHVLATTLAYLLLVRLTKETVFSFLLALLFLVHPLSTQAIAWIPGRNDTLFAVFALGSFLLWLSFLDSRKFSLFFGSAACLLAALFSKETGIVLPGVMVLYALVWKPKHFSFEKWWGVGMIWLLVFLTWALARGAAVAGTVPTETSPLITTTAISNIPAMLTYVGKVGFPYQLSVLPIVADGTYLAGIIALCTFSVILFLLRGNSAALKMAFFGSAWFGLLLLPAVSFHNSAVLPGQDTQLEHRAYLPLIGILLFLSAVIPWKTALERRKIFVISAVVVSLILAVRTAEHSANFQNRFVFWDQAIHTSPNSPLAHRNFAAMQHLQGNTDLAEKHYRISLALNPSEPMSKNNLALILRQKGNSEEAEVLLREEIRDNSAFSYGYSNLADILVEKGEVEEARDLWSRAYTLEPANPTPLVSIAKTYEDSDPELFSQLVDQLARMGISYEVELNRLEADK